MNHEKKCWVTTGYVLTKYLKDLFIKISLNGYKWCFAYRNIAHKIMYINLWVLHKSIVGYVTGTTLISSLDRETQKCPASGQRVMNDKFTMKE